MQYQPSPQRFQLRIAAGARRTWRRTAVAWSLLFAACSAGRGVRLHRPHAAPLGASASAAAGPVQVVQAVVEQQLHALATQDAMQAFALADTDLRTQFGSAEAFLATVREQYPMLLHPTSVLFLKPETDGTVAMQKVRITDDDGRVLVAHLPAEPAKRQPVAHQRLRRHARGPAGPDLIDRAARDPNEKGPLARPFLLSPHAQLRSALAIFLCFFAFLAWCVPPLGIVSVLLAVERVIELVAPMEPPVLPIEPPVVPAVVAAALPALEPWAIAPPPPPGVPVVPMGCPGCCAGRRPPRGWWPGAADALGKGEADGGGAHGGREDLGREHFQDSFDWTLVAAGKRRQPVHDKVPSLRQRQCHPRAGVGRAPMAARLQSAWKISCSVVVSGIT